MTTRGRTTAMTLLELTIEVGLARLELRHEREEEDDRGANGWGEHAPDPTPWGTGWRLECG